MNDGEQNLSWNVYNLYSFTSIPKSKSLAKMRTLNAGTLELNLTKLPSLVLWSQLLLMKPLMHFEMVILTQRTQNLEFVNLKCVTYAQPIRLPSRNLPKNQQSPSNK